MRTIEKTLYQFSELSEKAQERAVEQNSYNQEYFWNNDALKSLEKFAEHFGATLKRYEIDWQEPGRSFAKFETPDEPHTAKELRALIKSMGTYDKETLRGLGDCKFTGFCMDEDAADGARIAYHNGERDLGELLQAGFQSWHKAATADYEHQLSKEGFEETCESNEWEFNEDGTRA